MTSPSARRANAAAFAAVLLAAAALTAPGFVRKASADAPSDLSAHRYGAWGVDLTGRDLGVRPGDDFFAYANGAYFARTEIPADLTWYGTVNILRDLSDARVHVLLEQLAATAPAAPAATDEAGKIGAAYNAFMDEKTIEAKGAEPLQPDLAAIRDASDRAGLTALMGQGRHGFQPSLFGFAIGTDDKHPDRYDVELAQGGLGLPDRDYYLVAGFAAKKAAYQAYVGQMLTLVGWPDPQAAAKAVVDYETAIAAASWTKAERRDPVSNYDPMSVSELASAAPGFDFKALLSAADLGGVDRVVVNTHTAVTKIAALYAATPLDTLKAWQAFHLANGAAPYLSKAFVDAQFDFEGRTLAGQPALAVRWKRGVRTVSAGFGEAIGRLYVAKYFPPDSKAKMQALVDNLKAAYRTRIERLAWMSPQTKAKALEKLAAMDVQIGYPKKWRDYSALMIRADDLYGDVARAKGWRWDYQVARLNQPVDKDEWGMTPQTVNAYNRGEFNEVVFPAAILQPPVFDPDADPAVNYGAIGAVIGHEMSHGFDDQGRQYDAHGALNDWWTPEDAAKFIASTKSFGAQYEALPILPGAHINGALTMGENIADLAGILAAYDAYHASLNGRPAPVIDGLTGDQRFFLAFAQYYRNKWREDFQRQMLVADPHSPDKARVDVVLPNVDAWYAAFDVKPGDKLYRAPEDRVRIW
jgi:putative endopeptidase